MIDVENLTKFYGDYPAIENVSFNVERGQIVGFLGPNGAGKTTTMRILAGYLTATSGKATIDGINVFWKPIQVRKRIGYLPENCPLYTEMRVREYLKFRAGVKGIHGFKRGRRVRFVIDRCWLKEVDSQIIGTLSKGYRQRVGLADSLLADPPVLILDEPTSGLDPKQIRSTRSLIRELAQEHTVLLSTHILSEVEMTCDHAIIIADGRVAASGSLTDLKREAGSRESLTVRLAGQLDIDAVRVLDDAGDIAVLPVGRDTQVRISTSNADELSPRFCTLAHQKGWKILELRREGQTLEDLFVRYAGGEGAVDKDHAEDSDRSAPETMHQYTSY